jgi:WD40 repeat protein
LSDTPDEPHPGAPDTDPAEPAELTAPAELTEPADLTESADPAEFVLPPADPARVPSQRPDRRSGRPTWITPAIACVVLVPILVMLVVIGRNRSDSTASSTGSTADSTTGDQAGDGTTDSSAAAAVDASDTSLAPLEPYDGWVNPASVGRPYSDKVDGLLSFRGNPTRTYYGKGPVPTAPQVLWTFPAENSGGLCSQSSDEQGMRTWCGSGWTGQPNVWEKDGKTWVAFGAYDRGVHFLDAESGTRLLPDFKVGDIIKGTVTVDPDGFPILYTGARDNFYRALALDEPAPTELWKLWAYDTKPVLWNDDWDGSGLILDDYLFEGGENGWIYAVKLNRAYDANGKVTVDPKVVWKAPGWDAEQLKSITDKQVSIENSVAISGNTLYFANSGGLVQGWDISGLKTGTMPTRTFRFWTGDDTDASIVIDADGMLYVGSEWERNNARSKEVGQIMKLDPTKPDNPLVWSIKDQGASKAGVWGTSALWKDMLYTDTNGGRLLGIDRATGAIRWEKKLPGPTWQSPVVVGDVLIVGDCSGVLHAYDVSDTTIDPPELWTVKLSGCIESTPAVWNGRIFVWARGGRFYAIGDADKVPATPPNEPLPATSGPPKLQTGSKG